MVEAVEIVVTSGFCYCYRSASSCYGIRGGSSLVKFQYDSSKCRR